MPLGEDQVERMIRERHMENQEALKAQRDEIAANREYIRKLLTGVLSGMSAIVILIFAMGLWQIHQHNDLIAATKSLADSQRIGNVILTAPRDEDRAKLRGLALTGLNDPTRDYILSVMGWTPTNGYGAREKPTAGDVYDIPPGRRSAVPGAR